MQPPSFRFPVVYSVSQNQARDENMPHTIPFEMLPDIIRAYAGPWLMFGFIIAIITKLLPPNKTVSKRIIGFALCLYAAIQLAGQCKQILPDSELFSQAYFFFPAVYLVIMLYEHAKPSAKS